MKILIAEPLAPSGLRAMAEQHEVEGLEGATCGELLAAVASAHALVLK